MLDQRFRPPNFARSVTPEDPNTFYTRTVIDVTRRFIYSMDDLKPIDIERAIGAALSNTTVKRIEDERGNLEALKHFLQGVAEHELANKFHYAWLAELARRQNPETLTRKEVTALFENFERKPFLQSAEKRAIQQYEDFLTVSRDGIVNVSDKISLERSDIEMLIIDLKTRITERNPNAEERRAELEALDDQLAEIITNIPDEQHGKRLELKEIYLLRRLIRNADTGHLATVSHGTPREDLRSDRGVDIVLTAAGDVYEFQVKTFKSGTHREARGVQAEVRARAERNLLGKKTRLVELKTEDIEKTYGNSRRQASGTRHTLADKFAALEPITHNLRMEERERLLKLTGLTEQELAQEQIARDKRQAERKGFEDELKQERTEQELRDAAAEAQTEAKRKAAEDAERDRLERITKHDQAQREESERKRAAIVAATKAKQQARDAEQAAEALEAAAKAAEAAKKEIKRMEKEWADKEVIRLNKPETLIELGMLMKENRNNPSSILAAKKLLAVKYPNTKSVLKDFPLKK